MSFIYSGLRMEANLRSLQTPKVPFDLCVCLCAPHPLMNWPHVRDHSVLTAPLLFTPVSLPANHNPWKVLLLRAPEVFWLNFLWHLISWWLLLSLSKVWPIELLTVPKVGESKGKEAWGKKLGEIRISVKAVFLLSEYNFLRVLITRNTFFSPVFSVLYLCEMMDVH